MVRVCSSSLLTFSVEVVAAGHFVAEVRAGEQAMAVVGLEGLFVGGLGGLGVVGEAVCADEDVEALAVPQGDVVLELGVTAATFGVGVAAQGGLTVFILGPVALPGDVDDCLAGLDFLLQHRGDGLAGRCKILLLYGECADAAQPIGHGPSHAAKVASRRGNEDARDGQRVVGSSGGRIHDGGDVGRENGSESNPPKAAPL